MQKFQIIKPQNTPLLNATGLFGISKLFVKDETKNPTHTFKDRLAYEMLRPTIETLEKGHVAKKTTFGSISYGNTAYSMGYYCQKLNKLFGKEIVRAIAFMPPQIVNKQFGPNTEGRIIKSRTILSKIRNICTIIDIDLNKKQYLEKDLEKIAKNENKLLGNFIDITEGLDRPAYVGIIIESLKQMKTAPDYVIVPFGAGILCNEIIDYIHDNNIKTKVIPVSSGDPKTIAIMLYGPIWVDTKTLLENGSAWTKHNKIDRKGRKREPYIVHHITDEEIIETMKVLKKNKITAEASAASGFAILHRLKKIDNKFDPKKHSVLVINTGNGLMNY